MVFAVSVFDLTLLEAVLEEVLPLLAAEPELLLPVYPELLEELELPLEELLPAVEPELLLPV